MPFAGYAPGIPKYGLSTLAPYSLMDDSISVTTSRFLHKCFSHQFFAAAELKDKADQNKRDNHTHYLLKQ